MSLLKTIEMFQELKGYMGAGVFRPDGKMIAGVTEVSGINFEIAGSIFHDTYLIANNNTKEVGFGSAHMLQINADTGVVFFKCHRDEEVHFHTILVVNNSANISMAKAMLKKVIAELKLELQPAPKPYPGKLKE